MNTIRIGWAGLGNMGIPMVRNLVRAGFDVTVYNRTVAKARTLKVETGVRVVTSPRELTANADIIITMVTDDAALKAVYQLPDGMLSGKIPVGLLAIDMSTVSPDTTKELAILCREKGIGYLDAPVSGGVKSAEDAKLVIMAGGRENDFERAKPVFGCLGKAAHLMGENGSGNYAKLAINTFLGITMQGLAEAVVFARKNGIAPESLLSLINSGPIGSVITKMKSPNILNNNFKPAFALNLLHKDIRLAKAQGLDTPLGNALADSLQAAMKKGYGEEDMMAIIKSIA
ncbi:3-hydroxyisobutyrate dehydrogenase [Chitinophaga sp. CF118]|uniref:NAD(P)-dependent oxidoreductase n=1 Tax=Chitinophaga sp. CF118 TaxID=1884367 RepID=UPI0008EF27D5|nr:NAD(P)-dependent oxidoreductase [Chitinophaga sp. CF118]SFD22964.1 3-hydroxyisobutyrate dehydrogenase [Chitinophaga sp. CF118]